MNKRPLRRPRLPRRWEEEVHYRELQGKSLNQTPGAPHPEEMLGRAEIKANREVGEHLPRPKLPASLWLRSTKVLCIDGLCKRSQINRGVARLLVTCFMISEALCPRVHRRFVDEIRSIVRWQRSFFRKWRKLSPGSFFVDSDGRCVAKRGARLPKQLAGSVIPGDGAYRKAVSRRFPARLGILLRFNYAQLGQLLATAGTSSHSR